MTIRAQVMRLNPTPEQEAYFYRAAGIARFVWNWALVEYKAAKERGEKIDWNELQKRFNVIKYSEFPFVTEVSKSVAQVAFMDLRQVINTYYKAKKKNSKSKLRFPKLRKRRKQIGGFGLQNNVFKLEDHTVIIQKLGEVNISHPLRFGSCARILNGRVKYKAGHWYLIVTIELSIKPMAATSDSIGVDFGLKQFATLSNGMVYETQGYFRQAERKLKLYQKALSRKKMGSKQRVKQKIRVACCHEHVANQRKDFLHKMTTTITNTFAVICVEDLHLNGMAQSKLAKSVHDAGIGEAIRQLTYKATVVQKVGRFFPSSKRCFHCRYIYDDLRLSDRIWTCPRCRTIHDRDLNAAKNIELEGIRLLAGTGWVGVTPAELVTSTLRFGAKQATGYETGSFS